MTEQVRLSIGALAGCIGGDYLPYVYLSSMFLFSLCRVCFNLHVVLVICLKAGACVSKNCARA